MLKEIVPAETLVMACFYITCPPLKVSVTFILMTNPIGFAFEHLWSRALVPGASKGLHILVDVFCPVGWLHKLLGRKAQSALELSWEVASGRHRDILREALVVNSALDRRSVVVVVWRLKGIQVAYILILVQQNSSTTIGDTHNSRRACCTQANMRDLVLK
jgi:hypothetical protein